MPTQFDKNPRIDRALRHSVRDGMAFSVAAGGGETYFSAFALFLRATAPQVALLTTLPPLVGSLGQFLSAWAGQRLGRKFLILAGAGLQAITWLLILGIPLLWPAHAITSLLLLLILYHGAGHIAAPQWTSLMRDLVSDRRRGRYFGHRTRWTTVMSFVALLACGGILHGFDQAGRTELGFVVVFVIAFAARAVSVYHLGFLTEPEPSADGAPSTAGSVSSGSELNAPSAVPSAVPSALPSHAPPHAPPIRVGEWIAHLHASGAVRFSVYFMLMNLSVAIASPFFAVYVLRDLEFSYLQFMFYAGASVLVQVLTLNRWGRIADVFGNRLILIVTSMSIPIVPALWLLSNDFWYLLLVQAIAGLSWGGFSLSAGNILFELLPRTQRVAYVALHNVAAAAAVFTGAMIGAALATLLPQGHALFGQAGTSSALFYLFAISAAARALVALLGVRKVPQLREPRRKLSAQALVLRITGFNAFVGLWYELIGSGDKRK